MAWLAMNLGNRRYICRRLRGGSSWWGGSSRAIQPSFTQLSEPQLDKVTIKSLHLAALSGFFRGGVVSGRCRMNEHDDPVRWCFVLVACSNRGPTRQSVCRSPRPSSPPFKRCSLSTAGWAMPWPLPEYSQRRTKLLTLQSTQNARPHAHTGPSNCVNILFFTRQWRAATAEAKERQGEPHGARPMDNTRSRSRRP